MFGYSITICIQWISLSLTVFLLWNFKSYLQGKPPGNQTLLDFAYIQLFEYLATMNMIFTIICTAFYIFNGQVYPILAEIIAWSLLISQQLFYYQLLICAVIRLGIVLHFNLASIWKRSEKSFFKTIRISVLLLAILVTLMVALKLDFHHPFSVILQGQSKLQSKIRVGPTLAFVSLMVQFTSRAIVRLRVGPSGPGPSNELVNTHTFLFIFLYLLACHLSINLLKIVDFQISMTFGHGGFLVCALQILYHSEALKGFFQRKYPVIKRICQVFGMSETSSNLSTVYNISYSVSQNQATLLRRHQNSVQPI